MARRPQSPKANGMRMAEPTWLACRIFRRKRHYPAMIRPLALFVLVPLIGCAKTKVEPVAEPVDPDDVPITLADVEMPTTYRDAVERVRSYRDLIRDALAANTPGKAHRPLDESEFVLDAMPYLARKDCVPKRHWETVVLAAEDISELFNQVHSAIDEHREPDFAAVADAIEAAIERLGSVTPGAETWKKSMGCWIGHPLPQSYLARATAASAFAGIAARRFVGQPPQPQLASAVENVSDANVYGKPMTLAISNVKRTKRFMFNFFIGR